MTTNVTSDTTSTNTITTNKATVRRLAEAANTRNPAVISAVIDEVVDPDVRSTTPLPVEATGAEGEPEDGLLVEHFVTAESQSSMIGNIYLGRVQNVLSSMEAAFIDIGQGRNGVLYASEVDWKSAGLGGRSRRIEQALKSGDQVLVQVTKDPVGHKGARLTTQISLAGRYLVYVPGGRSAGISRSSSSDRSGSEANSRMCGAWRSATRSAGRPCAMMRPWSTIATRSQSLSASSM